MTFPALARIRAAARAGDMIRAWRVFDEAGLCASDDPAVLTLKGRLLKDRALRHAGAERAILLDQAQSAYMQAGRCRRATYPLINAATLARLNGRTAEAERLATDILALIDSGDHEAETAYWRAATAAEAHLLLGQVEASRHALEQAVAAAPLAWEDHAATLRQFRQISAAMSMQPGLFDHLCPPPSLYFSGIIGLPDDHDEAAGLIGAALDDIRPGAVFGALAAGSDIVIAELAVARGAELHVILPIGREEFRRLSVTRFGAHWGDRFDRLIAQAASLDMPPETALSAAAIVRGAELAMGRALRRADMLSTRAIALHVGRRNGDGMAQASLWRDRGLPIHSIMLDNSCPAPATKSDHARNAVLLACVAPFPPSVRPCPDARHRVSGDMHVVEFADVSNAIAFARAMLGDWPDCGLGMEYRTLSPGEAIDREDGLAQTLARAVPAGALWTPWRHAAAFQLHVSDCRFECGGEIITVHGDCPVAHYHLPG